MTGPAESLPLSPRPPRPALRLLLLAWDYADMVRRDPWDFAVEWVLLQQTGATLDDIRRLIHQGYAHHADEKTTPRDKRRVFGPLDSAALTDKTCFVLTEAGANAVRLLYPETASTRREVPFYQRARGELWVCGFLVKRFRQPAPDQRSICSAFQDHHWHFRIANPLSPHYFREDLKVRLNHAIYRLNRKQVTQLIRLGGDGTGQGVIWEPWAPMRKRS
jgi:hypothetical protein